MFRKFRSTFANQSGPFKRTNKVTEFFVVLSEVSDEVCDWDSEWGSGLDFGPGFGTMKK